MNRQEVENRQVLEKRALDLVAGRKAAAKAAPKPKQKMSAIAKVSMVLWFAAIAVIGSLAVYVFSQK